VKWPRLFILAAPENTDAARIDVNYDMKLLVVLAISTFIGMLYINSRII
jgi:hypothetical protein